MIQFIAKTGSTNADLAARLASGEHVPEGHWLVAERQFGGRGRQGRDWFDGTGNFMGSTVIHRSESDPPAQTLALACGMAAYEAILPYCPNPNELTLKWPNDVLLSKAKLCGILLEASRQSIVVGIGVNLSVAPKVEGRATIALGDVTAAPKPEDFARTLANHLDAELERWRNVGVAPLIRRWSAAAHPVGTDLKVHDADGGYVSGTFAGLTEDGSLRLRLADGETRAIHSGDITLD